MKITSEKVFGIDICIGIPTGELAGIVDRFFELKGNPSFIAHRLFPGGYSEILFNLGDVLHASISSSKNENRRITCRQFLVSGIKTGYFDVTSPVNMHCVGVRFKVDGIKRLFDISPAEFTDNDFNLDEIIARSAAHNLYESLAECRTPVERFNLLSRLLIKKLISSKNDYTAESIVKRVLSRPFLSINNLEKETGYSRQYLHRVFKSFTGISIKKFQQINRITSVLKSMNKNGDSLSGLTYSGGYFDQSHFIKDFKQLTGYSPASYLSSVRSFEPDPYFF